MLVVIVLLQNFVDTAFCVIFRHPALTFEAPSDIFEQDMEANKENSRRKIKTRIPLPLEPLPALPKHLFNDNLEDCINEKRHPLRTLAQTNVLPSSSNCNRDKPVTQPRKIKLDTKHVTMRKKNEDLDWNLKVFRDHDENIICVTDDEDEENNCKNENLFDGNKRINCLGASLAITPSEPPAQHKNVRNIKRSLKRPHSRELQGLSPACKVEKDNEGKVKRRLEFSQGIQERIQTPDFSRSYMTCMDEDYKDYIFKYLLVVERKPLGVPNIPRITRACVINWLMKINGRFGNPAVVQSACWYIDSILGTKRIKLESLQLISTGCYWIAQKLHGSVMSAPNLMKLANYTFSQERLLDAEKGILITLGFPSQPVTPHEYITYLAWWCDSSRHGGIEVAATFLCMSGLMVMKELCQEYPSVIAAAAVRNAVLLLKKKEMVQHLYHCPMYKAAENKASNFSYTCALIRKAVRTVADRDYEYNAPVEHYGIPPHYIAQEVINAVRH